MVIKENMFYPPAGADRMLHIWLPDDYEESAASYPVMYFFDGHNLFFDEDATYGKSWGFVPYLQGWDKDLILVGIECSHEGNARLYEYMPYAKKKGLFSLSPCLGDATVRWILEDIKPMIDRRFRTLPGRAHTGIGGASMGGLMALYAGAVYNASFSRAACVSSSIPFCLRPMLADLDRADLDPDSRFFLSFGTLEAPGVKDPDKEDRSSYTYRCNKAALSRLEKKGAKARLYCQVGGRHCEADWEKQIPLFMPFLWQE